MSLCSDNSRYLGSFKSPPCPPCFPPSSAAIAGHWEQAMPLADDIKQEPGSPCARHRSVCVCAGGQNDPQHQVSHSAPPPSPCPIPPLLRNACVFAHLEIARLFQE